MMEGNKIKKKKEIKKRGGKKRKNKILGSAQTKTSMQISAQ